jgi:hypothetical protein
VQLQGRTADDSVLSRVGFLYEQYRPEYLYWDVVETVRKLYLVTVVAFFENGSQLQLVLSVIISSMAFAYHVYALPYTDRWLNVLQGACLFMIWASLQAGTLMVATQPNLNAGSALLTAISVANIVMLVSPAVLILLAVLQVVPASIRTRFSSAFKFDADTHGSGPDDAADEIGSVVEPVEAALSHPQLQDDDTTLIRGDTSMDHSTAGSAVQLEMVEMVGLNMSSVGSHGPHARVDVLAPPCGSLRVNPVFAGTLSAATADAVTVADAETVMRAHGLPADTATVVLQLFTQLAERNQQQAERSDGIVNMQSNPLAGAQLCTVAPRPEIAGTTLMSVIESLPADSAAVVRRALAQCEAENQELKREVVALRRQLEPAALAPADFASWPPVRMPVAQAEQLWVEYQDQEGSTYYHHRVTGETTWSKPE